LNREKLFGSGLLLTGLMLLCLNFGELTPQRNGQISGPLMAVLPRFTGIISLMSGATLLLRNLDESKRSLTIVTTGILLLIYCSTQVSIQNCQIVQNGEAITSFLKIIGPEHIIQLQYIAASITTIGLTYMITNRNRIRKNDY